MYWWIFLLLLGAAECRGRYEYIDDADLPAFYRLRAQLAQQAAARQAQSQQPQPLPQAASAVQSPVYSSIYPYQYYQPATQTAPATLTQYVQYYPQAYRQVMTSAAQPRFYYYPYAAYYGQQAGYIPATKKKSTL